MPWIDNIGLFAFQNDILELHGHRRVGVYLEGDHSLFGSDG